MWRSSTMDKNNYYYNSVEFLDADYRGKAARKAYRNINIKENFRTPDFFTYQELLTKFRKLF